ncbi:helix-turn-helix transcriptional regulator [Nodosilinea sp. LEGE 06152]|uniref:helix-turn-helix domain-containing protein n=1 Tax=Nodosilinea sp. LEGE 06152 TaxID=2777966 RepID=UPI001881E43C|nr:AraC family transcriptional regulator [Nodosilinea sp. LEGE 06152]MBE9158561.1 helix-turn-helix transcriptional regulator [Nodosilinea sp. LEGE 06152]
MPVDPLDLFAKKPAIAHHSIPIDSGLMVHYRHDLPGELHAPQGLSHHMLTFFLSKNERQVTQVDEGGEYDGVMEPGDFYLCPAGQSAFTRWQSVDKTLHIVLEPDFLDRVAFSVDGVNSGNVELLPVVKTRDRKLESLVQLFLTETEQSGFGDIYGDKLYLESLSSLVGVHLLRHYCNIASAIRPYTAGLAPYQVKRVLEYIQAHLSQELSLDAMAAQVGLSRSHFAHQFKQAMGVAPHQYVSQQRVEKAQRLLRSRQIPITDIALECGFANQSHLTKVFKKHTGTTPKAYRQQL